LAREGKILMLPYAEFRKIGAWFGVPTDRDLYRSLAAHEAAHALASANFTVRPPSIQAHEYIAYVTMFSTMEPALPRANPRSHPRPRARADAATFRGLPPVRADALRRNGVPALRRAGGWAGVPAGDPGWQGDGRLSDSPIVSRLPSM